MDVSWGWAFSEVGLLPPCSFSPSGLDTNGSGISGDSGAMRWKDSQSLNDSMKETLSLT